MVVFAECKEKIFIERSYYFLSILNSTSAYLEENESKKERKLWNEYNKGLLLSEVFLTTSYGALLVELKEKNVVFSKVTKPFSRF